MKCKQNLHTHTTHCDGRDTPREMIERAIELGFHSLGFSRHSYTPFSEYNKKTAEQAYAAKLAYIDDIQALKAEYADRIRIFLGYEFDMYSPETLEDFEYVIGSVHYPIHNGQYVNMDRDAETVKGIIERDFGGDGLLYAKNFYENAARLPEIYPFDIVGHFDLLTKHSEKQTFFDTGSHLYRNYALEALHAVAEKIKVFEVNTGAIARGYRTTPYPAPFIMRELKNLGCDIVISSDCHNKDYLDCCFDEAVDYARSFGFGHILELTESGFRPIKI